MQKLTVEKLLDAIEKKRGNVAAVARGLGVTRKAVYKRIKASTQLQEALDDAREVMLDDAEETLYDRAIAGGTAELIFFLKTQGRRRGYVERIEHNIDIDAAIERELAALADSQKAGTVGPDSPEKAG